MIIDSFRISTKSNKSSLSKLSESDQIKKVEVKCVRRDLNEVELTSNNSNTNSNSNEQTESELQEVLDIDLRDAPPSLSQVSDYQYTSQSDIQYHMKAEEDSNSNKEPTRLQLLELEEYYNAISQAEPTVFQLLELQDHYNAISQAN